MLSLKLKLRRVWFSYIGLIVYLSFVASDANAGQVERTLGIIKPDGVSARHADAIKKIIEEEGFKIVAEKDYLFDEEGAKSFYSEHAERAFFSQLVQFMTSGHVLAMVLEKENAIKDWRALMGPTDSNKARIQAPSSVRAKFGLDGQSNCVHGSDSPEAAAREIETFFDFSTSGAQGESTISKHDEL